ncbi:MAG: hypothetical protein SGPRY_014791, partial [Prymnesium sp.]
RHEQGLSPRRGPWLPAAQDRISDETSAARRDSWRQPPSSAAAGCLLGRLCGRRPSCAHAPRASSDRAACAGRAGSVSVLPRKELFEAWEVATTVHYHFPTARRVADLASGHSLLAWILLLLAAESGVQRSAVCVDVRMPASADTLRAAFLDRWPALDGQLHYVEGCINAVDSSPDVRMQSQVTLI